MKEESVSSIEPPCVVCDLDNTIIDTAVRKYTLLKVTHPKAAVKVTLEDVREDFWLTDLLGDRQSQESKDFFKRLDSVATIYEHPAPAMLGAVAVIKKWLKWGHRVVVMTSRPAFLRSATVEDLKRIGLNVDLLDLIMAGDATSGQNTKAEAIAMLGRQHSLVIVVGDRLEDVRPATAHACPAILLTTTLSRSLTNDVLEGCIRCSDWAEVESCVSQIVSSVRQMGGLRDLFAVQYSTWLGDIDKKASISVAVAGALGGLSGKLLFDAASAGNTEVGDITSLVGLTLLAGTFFTSVLSLIYSILTYTSRRTSGGRSGSRIRAGFKQWIGIFLGTRFSSLTGDALDKLKEIRELEAREQARAHIQLFFERYQTYNLEAIKNIRLFELRASNYSKLYAERLASKLLIIAIILLTAWAAVMVGDAVIESYKIEVSESRPAVERT